MTSCSARSYLRWPRSPAGARMVAGYIGYIESRFEATGWSTSGTNRQTMAATPCECTRNQRFVSAASTRSLRRKASPFGSTGTPMAIAWSSKSMMTPPPSCSRSTLAASTQGHWISAIKERRACRVAPSSSGRTTSLSRATAAARCRSDAAICAGRRSANSHGRAPMKATTVSSRRAAIPRSSRSSGRTRLPRCRTCIWGVSTRLAHRCCWRLGCRTSRGSCLFVFHSKWLRWERGVPAAADAYGPCAADRTRGHRHVVCHAVSVAGWSPCGVRQPHRGVSQVCVIRRDGSRLQQLTFDSVPSMFPAWSLTGDRLVLVRGDPTVDEGVGRLVVLSSAHVSP